MGLSIRTNIAALATDTTVARTSAALETAQRRLATGLRINTAADDASGLQISEGLRAQMSGMTQATRNAQDGISVLQIADGALGDATTLLQRMRSLSVQAANDGSLNATTKAAIQKEIGQLGQQLNSIAGTTTFNGTQLLNGHYRGTFQVGANVGETLTVVIPANGQALDLAGLGLSGVDVTSTFSLPSTVIPAVSAQQGTPANGHVLLSGDFSTVGVAEADYRNLRGRIDYNGRTFDFGSVDYTGAVTPSDYLLDLNVAARNALGTTGYPFGATSAQLSFGGDTPGAGSTAQDAEALTPSYTGTSGAAGAITAIDRAIDLLSTTRADLGAMQNRFEHTISRLGEAVGNTTASESRIRDTDVASEFTAMSTAQVLTQSGMAMLAQANQSGQSILKLLAA